ncbi:MAG: metallophosphoesterase [Phycisphaerales bacterium]|nr:MAG: metallophosphoesterase [Phycisphaerales bacterium]
MLIGIVSDTHDDQRSVRQAIEIFKAQGLECILHAGDVTRPSTIPLFAELSGCRVIAVYGNCDSERLSLRAAVEAMGGEIHDRVYAGRIDGRAIYMTHIPHGIEQVVRSEAYDLVVYGHTHQQDIRRIGKTLIVNPGAARNWMGAAEAVIVDLADMSTTTQPLL